MDEYLNRANTCILLANKKIVFYELVKIKDTTQTILG